MKLEKWEELESAQSAPLAAGMTDLKGSDIPGSSEQQRDPRVISGGKAMPAWGTSQTATQRAQ